MDWKLELITAATSTGRRPSTQMSPGSLQNSQVVVSDIDAPRRQVRVFADPDGNGWVVQLPSSA